MIEKRAFNLFVAAGVATISGLATVDVLYADTRIFSVETDRPGVTVTTVQKDGQALAEVGQGGGRTFFEIDAGSAEVPCSNQLAFTTSTGQRVEYVVDLCAHNWQVVLPLGTAQAPPASPPSSPPTSPPSAPPSSPPASLTIYTDDPNARIDEVHLGQQPMTIASRQGNAVAVSLSPVQRAKCEQDLGLALADGRRVARIVDICTPSGSVVVALNDDTATPSVPPPPIGGPTTPPPAVPPAATAPTPASGEILVIENLTWTSGIDGNRATLTYASFDSQQVEFFASCNRGSKQIDVSFGRTPPEIQPGASVPVAVTAGTFAKTYTASGSDINALTGKSQAEVTIPTSDPFWPALIREEFLVIQIGSAPPYALSLKGSSAAARPFVDSCNIELITGPQIPPGVPPVGPPVVPPVGPPSFGSVRGDYACAEEPTLASQRTGLETQLIFRNATVQPVQLFWLDYDGRRQPYLSLAPGETGVQPTFFSHPWLVADLSGRCLAIYFARRVDTEVVIGP